MKTRTRKILLFLMVLVFAVCTACGCSSMIAKADSTSQMTIYFENNQNWNTINCYYWGNGQNSWPGTSMTKTDKQSNEGYDIYKISVNSGVNVIFNNGSTQTVDINNAQANTCYKLSTMSNGKYNVTSYVYEDLDDDDDEVVATWTIYFKTSYTSVNCYYWGGASTVEWPGVALTEKTEETDGKYLFKASVPQNSNVIFSTSQGQSVDITDVEENAIYEFTTMSGSKYNVSKTFKSNKVEYTVTVNCYDLNRNLLKTFVYTFEEGYTGTIYSPDVEGYQSLGGYGEITNLSEDITYSMFYEKAVGYITVYCVNNLNWSKVNCYYWGGSVEASWPGVEMKKTDFVDGVGNEVYSLDVASGSKVIFNNGSSQTVDISSVYDGNVYSMSSMSNGKYIVEQVDIYREITINYKDNNGNTIKNSTSFLLVKSNNSYTYYAPEIEGYDPVNTSHVFTFDDLGTTSYTFIYKNDEVVVNDNVAYVDSKKDLLTISQDSSYWAYDIEILEDIDLENSTISPIGNYSTYFTGDVNGNNCTISNFVVDASGKYNSFGLFGAVKGDISNLSIKNVSFDFGALTISDIKIGGLVGQTYGNVDNCSVIGEINYVSSGKNVFIGMVAGQSLSGTSITNISAVGYITFTGTNYSYVGGVVGEADGSIANCESSVSINVTQQSQCLYLGGVVGIAMAEANDLTNKGKIDFVVEKGLFTYAGGVVGNAVKAVDTVENYGSIKGTIKSTYHYVGGVVGKGASITNGAFYGNVNLKLYEAPNSYFGGFAGEASGAISYCEGRFSVAIRGYHNCNVILGGVVGRTYSNVSNTNCNLSTITINGDYSMAYPVAGAYSDDSVFTSNIGNCSIKCNENIMVQSPVGETYLYTEGEKAFYDRLVDDSWVIYYSNADYENVKSVYPIYYGTDFGNISTSRMYQIFRYFSYQNPIFCVVYSGYVSLTEGGIQFYVYNYTATDGDYSCNYLTAEGRAQLRDSTADYLYGLDALITSSMSTYQKAKTAYDYLMDSTIYEPDGSRLSYYYNHDITGIFNYGLTVCDGYAQMYCLLMNYLGIETTYYWGGNHAFNLVQMNDGYYYWADACWDDNNGTYDYFYFLKGKTDFTGHTSYLNYPVIGDWNKLNVAESAFVA